MRTSTRLVISICTLLLLALALTRYHTAIAKIVVEEPVAGEVGSILYHGAPGHYHTVRSGETLSHIAQYYGVSVGHIMAHNWQIKSPHLIYAGYAIWIPSGVGWGGGSKVPTGTYPICDCYHKVRYGDSLFGIAYRYGVNVQHIMTANGIIHPDYIYAGTTLYIPCPNW